MKPITTLLNDRSPALLGLIPVAVTLAGLYFLPGTAVLVAGAVVSLCALAADIAVRRELDPLLLLGALATGTCALVRLTTHGRLIPFGTEAPALEFLVMLFALVYLALPVLHEWLAHRLRMDSGWPCVMEAGTVVGLSVLHLLVLLCRGVWAQGPAGDMSGAAGCFIPALICTIVSLVRVAHVRMMERISSIRAVIRIAPVYGGKVFLERTGGGEASSLATGGLWDLPLTEPYEGPVLQAGKRAQVLVRRRFPQSRAVARLVHSYPYGNGGARGQRRVLLYILPLESGVQEGEEGRFFSTDELRARPDECSAQLPYELEWLELAARVWKIYGFLDSPAEEQTYL